MPDHKKFKPILTAALFSVLPIFGWSQAQATVSGLEWTPSDGEKLQFDVLRQGKPFGTHTISFNIEGDNLDVSSDVELEVKIGPFKAFYYKHDSDEVWTNGELVRLTSTTRKEGDDFSVEAQKDGDRLDVSGTQFSGELPLSIIPSSHWNIREVESKTILSTEDGRPLDIVVEKLGRETITAGGKSIEADKYRLKSELTVDLWYDASGKWVKCAFEARGQKIEYVLKS